MAATNRLEITGTLDLQQFWPSGSSDADTTKLLLAVDAGGVRIRLAGHARFQPTSVYRDAVYVTGKNKDTGQVETKRLINKGVIKIRLQRIDAPELHYRPDTRGSAGALKGTGLVKEYRQHQAETAVVKLVAYLKSFGGNTLACTLTSELKATDGPGAAIDKYGRFVGDVMLPDGTNLNVWLLENGLAVIALYDSMLPHEIDESIAAWQAGRKARKGIARHYTAQFKAFDPALIARPKDSNVQNEAARQFLHPKFYRRQASWWAFNKAGIFKGDFSDWLTSKAETCWYLPEFQELDKKAQKYPLYEREFDGNGIGWEPEDFIFAESPSSIQKPGAAGELVKIKQW